MTASQDYDPDEDPAIPTLTKPLARTLCLPWPEVDRAVPSTSDYVHDNPRYELAEGAHGSIILARQRSTSQAQLIVLKEFHPNHRMLSDHTPQGWDNALTPLMIREICVHQHLTHASISTSSPSILPSSYVLTDPSSIPGAFGPSVYLSMPFYPLSLSHFIERHSNLSTPIPLSQTKHLFRQLLSGLSFLHDLNIVHRDLTPSNILLDFNGVLKISDFGEAREVCDKDMTRRCTTIWWRAPEMCLGSSRYGVEVDMWAAGCILAEMLILEPLFQVDGDMGLVEAMGKVIGLPGEEEARDLGEGDGAVDFERWRGVGKRKREGEGGEEGSLRGRFERFGGVETVDMLRGILRWGPKERVTALEAMEGAKGGSGEGEGEEERVGRSVSRDWWRKAPMAEEARFDGDEVMEDLRQESEEFTRHFR